MTKSLIDAEPEPIAVDLDRTALIIIEMQRDFLEPGGFGETLGNDVSRLAAALAPHVVAECWPIYSRNSSVAFP
jgi:biuret amidohydrolase